MSQAIDHDQISRNRIFNLVDRIENKTGEMIEEIESLAELFRLWQDGKVRNPYMINTLSSFLDQLEMD